MDDRVQAVAAIIERGGCFLLGKRSPHKAVAPHYWCPLSGRIELGESQAEAVVREVREESGLAVRAVDHFAECPTHDGLVVIHWWRVEVLGDAPAQLLGDEHTELRWVRVEQMRKLTPIFDEDVAILARAERGLLSSR